jgi:UDP-N-acetylglucosamine transferase subunit ALG13
MFCQIPKIFKAIQHERKWLQQIIKEHTIDIVIADNRYGLYHKNAHCIFMTHQLFIKTGNSFVEKIAQKINYFFINKFNTCWVVDNEGDSNLAGALSHPIQLPQVPVKYIGTISRFNKMATEPTIDLLVLLSGPEPQRTIFEKIVLEQIKNIPLKITLVRGLPNEKEILKLENVSFFNHLSALDLNKVILSSSIIVSRSGYTTVMDLAALQKPSIFIPTPGQTEQVYLAEILAQKKYCITASQENFNLKKEIVTFTKTTFQHYPVFENDALQDAINLL